MAAKLRVTLVRSPISHTQRTRGTIRALGLHRLGETVELPDAPHTRGMVRAVRFLVATEEVAEEGSAEMRAEETAPYEAAPETTAPETTAPETTAPEEKPAPRRRTKKTEEAEE